MSYKQTYSDYADHSGGGFSGGISWAVRRLILITAAVFALQLILEVPLGGSSGAFRGAIPGSSLIIDWLAFDTGRLWAIWTFGTYMFLHANLWHLFSNMLGLFFFGPEVERTIGSRQFIQLYLASGALGVLASWLAAPLIGHTFIVGASGATMGVLVAFAVIAPNRQVYMFPLPIPLTARGLVIIVILLNLLTATNVGGRSSWTTHLGGMAVGYAFIKAIPAIRRWELERDKARLAKPKKTKAKKEGKVDAVGEAVDNIFKFDEKNRRR